jgi:hypothetical protein
METNAFLAFPKRTMWDRESLGRLSACTDDAIVAI